MNPIPQIGKQGWGLMKTDIRIQSKVRWKFGGVCSGEPGLGVEYHHDVGVFKGWVSMTRMKRWMLKCWNFGTSWDSLANVAQVLQNITEVICVQDSLPQHSHVSHSWTDSVRSHGLSQTYGSSPLAACTHLYASSVRLQSLSLSNLTTSIGHPAYTPVSMQHGHWTLWSDMHHNQKIILVELLSMMGFPTWLKCK